MCFFFSRYEGTFSPFLNLKLLYFGPKSEKLMYLIPETCMVLVDENC